MRDMPALVICSRNLVENAQKIAEPGDVEKALISAIVQLGEVVDIMAALLVKDPG